jgi:hypothetical protein
MFSQIPNRKQNTWKIYLTVFFQEIFNALLPLGIRIFSRGKESDGHLDSDSSAIIRSIVQRLTCDTAACLEYLDCWKFVQMALMDWKMVLQDKGGKTCPAIIMMQQVSLKGCVLMGFLCAEMSQDSSFSLMIRLQAGWLENHIDCVVGVMVALFATMSSTAVEPTQCAQQWVLGLVLEIGY